VVFRGGKSARANRGMWFDAAATGQDGALDRDGHPVYLDASHVGGSPPGPEPGAESGSQT
ncbi:MAG: hypothetical protein ABIP03_09370, partial [Aquihabitans sp.]